MNSLPKTVTRQRRDCDLNPGPSAPESSTLITRPPSHRKQPDALIYNKSRVVLRMSVISCVCMLIAADTTIRRCIN